MDEMQAISSAFLASSLLFLASCGKSRNSETRIADKPVLSSLVQAETKSQIDFARHVKPILKKRCAWCHDGSDESIPYALTNREEAFKNKRIVPGKPEQSLLFIAAGGEHPPLKKTTVGIKIAPSDLKVIERWIVSGAVWPAGEAGQLKRR